MSHIEHDTVVACASAPGAYQAVLRLSGTAAATVAHKAGLVLGAPWTMHSQEWTLGAGACPCRIIFYQAPRSFTGCDLVEIMIPGSPDVVELAWSTLIDAGALAATPGAFTRMAVATGKLRLDQAEAVLALAQAPTATAARQALERLRGALSARLGEIRDRLITFRALVEAGLDFVDEADVRAYNPVILQRELVDMRASIASFCVVADQCEDTPRICLVGTANAGKSALFNRLSGAHALVSPVAGTTRDWLDAPLVIGGRTVRLIDTAGWMEQRLTTVLDDHAVAAGRSLLHGATLIIACSAPDAPLPADHGLATDTTLIVATKSDMGVRDGRAVVAVSATTGEGLPALLGIVTERLGGIASGEPRQQRLLSACMQVLDVLTKKLPPDELLADDLRRCADLLGELIGTTTTDDVLEAIFSRFCIGK